MADRVNVGGIEADVILETGLLDVDLERVRAALEKVRAQMAQLQGAATASGAQTKALGQDYQNLVAVEAALVTQEQRLAAAMGVTATAMKGAAAATTQVNTAMAGVVGGGRNTGMALMQLGAIVDDVQYGFMGVVNNIQPLVMGLVGSAGIAAAIQVVAVGAFQLYKHWDDLMEVMGLGGIQTEAEQMERLANATKLTAEETAKLNEYKREQAEIAKMLSGVSKESAATDRAMQSAFDEGPGGKIAGALAAQMRGKLTPEQEAQLANLAHANPLQRSLPQEELRKKFEDQLDAEAVEKATQLMLDAKRSDRRGEIARDELRKKVERAPGAFPPGFLYDIETADPKERKKQEELEAQGRENTRKWEEDQRKKKQADRDELEFADLAAQEAEDSGKAITRTRRENERRRKENTQAGREAAPGIDQLAEQMVMAAQLQNLPPSVVQEQIKKYLMSKGRTEKQAGAAAEEITADAGKSVEEKITKNLLDGPQDEEMRHERRKQSEVFSISDLASKVQSSVGGEQDVPKKQLNTQQEMLKQLTALAARGGFNPRPK